MFLTFSRSPLTQRLPGTTSYPGGRSTAFRRQRSGPPLSPAPCTCSVSRSLGPPIANPGHPSPPRTPLWSARPLGCGSARTLGERCGATRRKRSLSHGGPGPPHWLRPDQSRSSPAAVGPGAAAPARTRSPCYALSNSPRYRVMCCCSGRRRCRRPRCPGSSAALRGGRRGRGRGSRVQGAARPRRPAASGCSRRPPQVMPPPPASA